MPTLIPHPPASRRSLGRPFRLLWTGESASLLGSVTSAVLMPLLAITQLGAGPGWMGLLTAAAWLPWLVIGLPAGAWLDRLDPRRAMIVADLVAAGSLASVPLAWWFGVLTLPQLLVVALIGGGSAVFFRTSYVKLLPRIVRDEDLETANSRIFGVESAAQVAGPGLAGLVAQVLSVAVCLVLNVVGFLVSAWCLHRVREHRPAAPATPIGSLRAQIAEGVATVVGDRNLRPLMIIGGSSNFGLTGYAALLVLFLVDRLGLSTAALGLVLMFGSTGGLLGAMVAPALARRFGSGRASTVLLVMSGPSALLIALPTSAGQAYLTAIGLFLVGFGVVSGNVIRGAWRQRYVPEALMGRVVTTLSVVNYGTMPLAGVAAGLLGNGFGVRPAMLVFAGIHLVATASILLTRLGRGRELPVQASV